MPIHPPQSPSRLAAPFLAALCLFLPLGCMNDGGSPAPGSAAQAELYVDQGKYAEAMTVYEARIAADSADSRAYWGYARAVLLFHGVTMEALRADFQAALEGDLDAYLDHPDSVVNHRLQALLKVGAVLDRFGDRDTLSHAYDYSKGRVVTDRDSLTGALWEARKAFILHYLDTVQAPSRQRGQFPLMDGRIRFRDSLQALVTLKLGLTILNNFDMPPRGVFDSTDRKFAQLLFEGGGWGDLGGDLEGALENDTALAAELNAKILELQGGLDNLDSLLTQIQKGDSAVSP